MTEEDKKLNDRELLEEIYRKQTDIQKKLGGISSNTRWSFIMIGSTILVLLVLYPPLWLR
jgi:hypothetical protein